jgi:hypothetical protein
MRGSGRKTLAVLGVFVGGERVGRGSERKKSGLAGELRPSPAGCLPAEVKTGKCAGGLPFRPPSPAGCLPA